MFLLFDSKEKLFLDSGRSDNRRLIHLETLNLPDEYRTALLGYHAFTGNDYDSSFFTKGKKKCWSKLKEDLKFVQCFSDLGSMETLSENQFQTIEEYVCLLRDVDNARYQLFKRKNESYNKIIDLALLPPCQNLLKLHSKRAKFVAYLWKQSLSPMINIQNDNEHDTNCEISWVEQEFPNDIEDILFKGNTDESRDDDHGDDIPSDDECEQDV